MDANSYLCQNFESKVNNASSLAKSNYCY
jgi:hypothetical protein